MGFLTLSPINSPNSRFKNKAKSYSFRLVPNIRHMAGNDFTFITDTDRRTRQALQNFSTLQQVGLLPKTWSLNNEFLHSQHGHRFLGVNLDPFLPTQYIGLNSYDTSLLSQVDEISVISGCCLFGQDLARAVLESGRNISLTPLLKLDFNNISEPVKQFVINQNLGLYEMEAISRLSSHLNQFVKVHNQIRTHVTLHIPKIEYYLTVFEAWSNNLMSRSLVQEWIEIVNKRQNLVLESFLEQCESIDKDDIPIRCAAPLSPINTYILDCVRNNNIPLLDEVCKILIQADPLFATLIHTKKPQTWFDLNHLSYSYAYFQAAKLNRDNSSSCMVAIENHSERRILSETQKIKTELVHAGIKLAPCPMLGFYPKELVEVVYGNDCIQLNQAPVPTTASQKAIYAHFSSLYSPTKPPITISNIAIDTHSIQLPFIFQAA